MPRTEPQYFKGKIHWCRHLTPNEWGKWSHVLYLDEESLAKFRKLQTEGVKNVLKKDDDGYSITLSRPTQVMFNNKIQGLQPPQMMLPDGSPLPATTRVGNGSDVTTKMHVYSHRVPGGGQAKAMRWEATRIDNLVPFDKEKDFPPEQAKQRSGLQEQPEPIF